MAASGNLGTQTVVAFDVRLGLAAQGQRLWRIQWRHAHHLAVDQPVQQVQDMGLGRHALAQRKFHSDKHRLFVVLQDEGQDIDHLAVTTGLA